MLHCALALSMIFAILSVPTGAASSTVSGRARVIDGDTLSLAGRRIRLEGIDAPELA
jgi:endonuclease YncB( thermonuclease family)